MVISLFKRPESIFCLTGWFWRNPSVTVTTMRPCIQSFQPYPTSIHLSLAQRILKIHTSFQNDTFPRFCGILHVLASLQSLLQRWYRRRRPAEKRPAWGDKHAGRWMCVEARHCTFFYHSGILSLSLSLSSPLFLLIPYPLCTSHFQPDVLFLIPWKVPAAFHPVE